MKAKYRLSLMRRDMVALGWMFTDLAAHTGLGHATIHRFFTAKVQTAHTAAKLANALGHRLELYIGGAK